MKKVISFVVAISVVAALSTTAFAGGHHRGGGYKYHRTCTISGCDINGSHSHYGYHYGYHH